MITIHTFNNSYDDGNDYHQFLQRGSQPLLDSLAVGQPPGGELRAFLENSIIGDCLSEPDLDERNEARFERVLKAALESGDIAKLLNYAGRVCVRGRPSTDPMRTRYGEWEYDSVVIEPPSLRELQADMWAENEQFPKADWKHEVGNDDTTLGYWEWVAGKIEEHQAALVARNGYLFIGDRCLLFRHPAGDADMVRWPELNIKLLRGALFDAREAGSIKDTLSVLLPDGVEFFIDEPYWKVGDRVTWNDPDGGACSHTGVLTAVSELGDFCLAIAMDDGWTAEVCESELQRVP